MLGLSLSCNNNNLQQNSNILNTSIYTSDFEQNDCKSELNKFKS